MIKLHPTIDPLQKDITVEEFIDGAIKSNDTQQYGYGLEAIRLWVASNDNDLGNRYI
jgi:hypothetical protein